MSEAKDADVDRLTRREIEEYLGMLDGADMILDVEQSFMKRLCDLALQSLSQEAVRDEAQIQAETLAQLLGAAILRLKALGETSWELPPYARALALKREPNAEARDRSTERASGERTSAGTSPSPARAAPDVANEATLTAEWLEAFAEGLIHPESPFTQREIAQLRKAAALLAKLGQGWIPPTEEQEAEAMRDILERQRKRNNLGASDD